jgi:hypothetical protein
MTNHARIMRCKKLSESVGIASGLSVGPEYSRDPGVPRFQHAMPGTACNWDKVHPVLLD